MLCHVVLKWHKVHTLKKLYENIDRKEHFSALLYKSKLNYPHKILCFKGLNYQLHATKQTCYAILNDFVKGAYFKPNHLGNLFEEEVVQASKSDADG